MMKRLLALLLVVIGVVGGGGLGLMLRPDAAPRPGPAPPEAEAERDPKAEPSFVKLSRQMIVPVVEGNRTRALMLFEIALDVPAELNDAVYAREPRLRDAFLREMFEMAHTGAFLETYTDERVMEELRRKLLAAARLHLGAAVHDVLILDAARQER